MGSVHSGSPGKRILPVINHLRLHRLVQVEPVSKKSPCRSSSAGIKLCHLGPPLAQRIQVRWRISSQSINVGIWHVVGQNNDNIGPGRQFRQQRTKLSDTRLKPGIRQHKKKRCFPPFELYL